jgi:hypothetical protein
MVLIWLSRVDLLTPCSRVLLEKLTGLQLVKKFPAFYKTRRFITAFKSARQLSLFLARSIQSITPHPTSWRFALIVPYHLHLGLPSGLRPSCRVDYQTIKIMRSSVKFLSLPTATYQPPSNILWSKWNKILTLKLLMFCIYFQKIHCFLTFVKTHFLKYTFLISGSGLACLKIPVLYIIYLDKYVSYIFASYLILNTHSQLGLSFRLNHFVADKYIHVCTDIRVICFPDD